MTFPTQEELAREHVLILYNPTIHPITYHYFHKHGYVDTVGSYHTSGKHHYHSFGEAGDAHDPAEHGDTEQDALWKTAYRLTESEESQTPHGDDSR